MPETDEELYELFRAGEENALRILMERYQKPLTMFLYNMVHNAEDAEELTVDTFAVICSDTVRYHGKSAWKTWFYGIGRNLALKHLRRQRARSGRGVYLPETEEQLPEAGLLLKESNQELYAALQGLPEQYRQVLYLTEIENLNTEETARIMGKSRRQTYNLVFRGKQALRQALAQRGITEACDI